MIKQGLLLVLCLLTGFCTAQQRIYTLENMPFVIDSLTGDIVYRGVVKVKGVSADQLVARAKLAVLAAFPKDNQVIKTDDPASGVVIGKGRLFLPANSLSASEHAKLPYYELPLEIQVKDGEYQYLIKNIDIIQHGVKTSMTTDLRRDLPGIRQKILSEDDYYRSLRSVRPFVEMIAALKRNMRKQAL